MWPILFFFLVGFSAADDIPDAYKCDSESNPLLQYAKKMDKEGIIKCLDPTDPMFMTGSKLGKEVMDEKTHVGHMYGPVRAVYGQYGNEGDSDFLQYYVIFHWPAGKDSQGKPNGDTDCLVHFSNNKKDKETFKTLLDGPVCFMPERKILEEIVEWIRHPSDKRP